MFADNTTHKIDDYLNLINLKGSIQNFEKVEYVGVDELTVYESLKQTVSFNGER